MGVVIFMTIKVYRTAKQVLHKLTSMREYALIRTERTIKDARTFCLVRLISSEFDPVKKYIYIGDHARSRERFDRDECLRKIQKKFPLIKDSEISFPVISELYELSEGKILEIDLKGKELSDVNQKWISNCLQFKKKGQRKYLNDDFSTVKLSLSKIAGRTVRRENEEPVPVDIADFEVYDRMIDILLRIDKEQHYGDAACIEYSIISDGYEYRYYLTHFFSNHNWNLDPQNLQNICFSAELLSGSSSRDSVRFSHPSKITSRRSNGSEYLVEMITMNNSDVSVKFRDGKTEEPSEGDVAGYRIYDNVVDFALWVDLYHQEIRMA